MLLTFDVFSRALHACACAEHDLVYPALRPCFCSKPYDRKTRFATIFSPALLRRIFTQIWKSSTPNLLKEAEHV